MAERRNNPFFNAVRDFAAQQQREGICKEIQQVINGRGLPIIFFFDSSKIPVCIEVTGSHANIAKGIEKKETEAGTTYNAKMSVGETVYCGSDAIDFLDCMGMMTPPLWDGLRKEAHV